MEPLKLWKYFGEKYCIIRTGCVFADERGIAAPLMYLGYLMDIDDEFIYISPTCDKEKICTSLELETIDEISLYKSDEEMEGPENGIGKIFSLVPPTKTPPSQDPAS